MCWSALEERREGTDLYSHKSDFPNRHNLGGCSLVSSVRALWVRVSLVTWVIFVLTWSAGMETDSMWLGWCCSLCCVFWSLSCSCSPSFSVRLLNALGWMLLGEKTQKYAWFLIALEHFSFCGGLASLDCSGAAGDSLALQDQCRVKQCGLSWVLDWGSPYQLLGHGFALQGNPFGLDASQDFEWQSATGTSGTSLVPAVSAGPVTEGHIPV